jgi:hypothetical protein
VQQGSVSAAFIPHAGGFFIIGLSGFDGLLVGVLTSEFAGLLPKGTGDLGLRSHFFLQLLPVPGFDECAGAAVVSGADAFFSRSSDTADATLGGAALAAAGAAYAGSSSVGAACEGLYAVFGGAVAFAVAAGEAEAAGFVGVAVLYVYAAEAGGGEAVLLVVYGRLGAADDAAFEVGVAAYADLEAAVSCLDAALLCDGCVVAVDLAVAEAAAGAEADAYGDAAAYAFLLAVEGGGVLQAFYLEVAAYVCGDLRGGYDCALQGGVASALQVDLFAADDVGPTMPTWLPALMLMLPPTCRSTLLSSSCGYVDVGAAQLQVVAGDATK